MPSPFSSNLSINSPLGTNVIRNLLSEGDQKLLVQAQWLRRHLSARSAISHPKRPPVAARTAPMPTAVTNTRWIDRPCSGSVWRSSCWSSWGPFSKSAKQQRKCRTPGRHCRRRAQRSERRPGPRAASEFSSNRERWYSLNR